MRSITVALAACTMAVTAQAAPVSLECTLDTGDKIEITLDESIRKVTHVDEKGVSFAIDGFFKPTEVGYRVVKATIIGRETFEYTVDRRTMKLNGQRKVEALGARGEPPVLPMGGVCELLDVKGRKF